MPDVSKFDLAAFRAEADFDRRRHEELLREAQQEQERARERLGLKQGALHQVTLLASGMVFIVDDVAAMELAKASSAPAGSMIVARQYDKDGEAIGYVRLSPSAQIAIEVIPDTSIKGAP